MMLRATAMASVLLGVAACGSEETSAIDAAEGAVDAPAGSVDAPAAIDAPVGAMTLTSTAFTNGGTIPAMYSCRGSNVSPPLAWTGGPAPGYAVVLTDKTNGLVHAAIWDIPGNVMALPENVAKVAEPPNPAGSKQPLAYDNQTRGYLGPCPQSVHTYEFAVYALDANPLPGVTVAMTTRTQLVAAIMAHDLASATLTATFTP